MMQSPPWTESSRGDEHVSTETQKCTKKVTGGYEWCQHCETSLPHAGTTTVIQVNYEPSLHLRKENN